jgi:ketosteroid isomerase-like protein
MGGRATAVQLAEWWYRDVIGTPESLRGFGDGTTPMPDYLAPDVVLDAFKEAPVRPRYRGRDELRLWVREAFDVIDDAWWELREVIELSPTVAVSHAHVHGRMTTTGLEIDFPMTAVHVARGGLVVYMKGFVDKDEAIAAAREQVGGGASSW